MPIHKLRAALLGGQLIDETRDEFAHSYKLLQDYPRLRGQVEEFRRNLKVDFGGLADPGTG